MAVEEKENETKPEAEESNIAPVENPGVSSEEYSNELRLPVWSVVSFEKLEAGGLTYAEAERKMSELEGRKVSGLCIVTDEVAARMSEKI